LSKTVFTLLGETLEISYCHEPFVQNADATKFGEFATEVPYRKTVLTLSSLEIPEIIIIDFRV